MRKLRDTTQNNNSDTTRVQAIPLDALHEVSNIRTDYHEIKELADSIEKHGLIQPITVKPNGNGYQIITGHRRARAYKYLLSEKAEPTYGTIPAIIKQNIPDIDTLQLIENIQREDLSPEDTEKTVKTLLKKANLTQNDLAERLGKSRVWVSQIIRAGKVRENVSRLTLDTETQEKARQLPTSTLASLAGIKDNELKKAIVTTIKNGGTRESARAVKNKVEKKKAVITEPLVNIKKHIRAIEKLAVQHDMQSETLHLIKSLAGKLKG